MSWQKEVDELRRRQLLAEGMGGPEGIARQHKRGKLTAQRPTEPFDGGFGCDRAHIGRGLRGKRPSEFAYWCARGGKNVDGVHGSWMT